MTKVVSALTIFNKEVLAHTKLNYNNVFKINPTGLYIEDRTEGIGILNSDDFFYPNALSYVKKYFNENNIDFLFGAVKKKKKI